MIEDGILLEGIDNKYNQSLIGLIGQGKPIVCRIVEIGLGEFHFNSPTQLSTREALLSLFFFSLPPTLPREEVRRVGLYGLKSLMGRICSVRRGDAKRR